MKQQAVILENVWKKYRIGAPKKLTEMLAGWVSADNRQKEFWALQGVGVKIQKGEVVGIIGPNGSGKSTLLKILSGITTPTKGSIFINGKVASLLELGAGFHPELTGLENIYLYGVILGMKKKEIDEKLPEIVTFSGIEQFLETPVKHYSSGMYIRLAFAVAINLDFDILLIDEIMAVGDAEFQQKSLKKIHEIVNSGKTVIIVSHDLEKLKNLCHKTILLQKGKIIKNGETKLVVSRYLQNLSNEN